MSTHTLSKLAATGWLLLGLCLLPLASYIIITAAINIASSFGMSELVIGLTIIAIGTSLPEIAASVTGVIKGEYDLAVGTVLGSNMFNLLAVLSLPGLIDPVTLNATVLYRDMGVMFLLTIVLFLAAYGFRGPGKITRWEGALLLAIYTGYLTVLVSAAL